MPNLSAWANTVVGRYMDVDEYAGNQCWDLSQAWLTACSGGTLWTQPSNFPGLAAGSWEVATGDAWNTPDLLSHVTPIPGSNKGMPGDIIIWAYGSPDYPISHTAVLVEDRGPTLYTISQNSTTARPDLPGYSPESSGPITYQELPRRGLLGFLRPNANITAQSSNIEIIQEDTLSAAEVQQINAFTQQVIQEERATIVREVRAAADRVGDRVGKEAYSGKVFNQQVMNENGDRIINDARGQVAGLREAVKQLAQASGAQVDIDAVFDAAKRGASEAIAEGVVKVDISIAKPELASEEVAK